MHFWWRGTGWREFFPMKEIFWSCAYLGFLGVRNSDKCNGSENFSENPQKIAECLIALTDIRSENDAVKRKLRYYI